MAGYTPLFGSIVTSSIWNEDSETRIVWITMLALANPTGMVEGSISGLAPVARVSIEACEKALEKLRQPDKYSRTKEFDGRRIIDVDGGWQILNYEKFREKARKRSAEYYRDYRKRKEPKEKDTIETHTQTHTQTGATECNIKPLAQQVAKGQLNTKKRSYPSKEEFVKYIKDKNLNISNPEGLFDGYNDGGWVDTQGKAVLNWKLKLHTLNNLSTERAALNQRPVRDFQKELMKQRQADVSRMLKELDAKEQKK